MSSLKVVHFFDGERNFEELWYKGEKIREFRDLCDCPEDATLGRDMISAFNLATIVMDLVDRGIDKNVNIVSQYFTEEASCREDLSEAEQARYDEFTKE